MLVGVVLPTYNSATTVLETLGSVLAQTHSDLVLFVVDDASRDDTFALCQAVAERDSRVVCYHCEYRFGGPARPRNIGLELCMEFKCDAIAYIDSDDVWHPTKLCVQLEAMCESKADFVCSEYWSLSDPMPSPVVLARRTKVTLLSRSMMLRKNRVATSSVLLTRKLSERLAFPELEKYIAVEDYVAWLKLLEVPSLVALKLDMPLVGYRTRGDSLSSGKWEMARKVWRILSDETEGKSSFRLGRYYYFCAYLMIGAAQYIKRRFNTPKQS